MQLPSEKAAAAITAATLTKARSETEIHMLEQKNHSIIPLLNKNLTNGNSKPLVLVYFRKIAINRGAL